MSLDAQVIFKRIAGSPFSAEAFDAWLSEHRYLAVVDVRTDSGLSALQEAARLERWAAVESLVAHGADASFSPRADLESPEESAQKCPRLALALLKGGSRLLSRAPAVSCAMRALVEKQPSVPLSPTLPLSKLRADHPVRAVKQRFGFVRGASERGDVAAADCVLFPKYGLGPDIEKRVLCFMSAVDLFKARMVCRAWRHSCDRDDVCRQPFFALLRRWRRADTVEAWHLYCYTETPDYQAAAERANLREALRAEELGQPAQTFFLPSESERESLDLVELEWTMPLEPCTVVQSVLAFVSRAPEKSDPRFLQHMLAVTTHNNRELLGDFSLPADLPPTPTSEDLGLYRYPVTLFPRPRDATGWQSALDPAAAPFSDSVLTAEEEAMQRRIPFAALLHENLRCRWVGNRLHDIVHFDADVMAALTPSFLHVAATHGAGFAAEQKKAESDEGTDEDDEEGKDSDSLTGDEDDLKARYEEEDGEEKTNGGGAAFFAVRDRVGEPGFPGVLAQAMEASPFRFHSLSVFPVLQVTLASLRKFVGSELPAAIEDELLAKFKAIDDLLFVSAHWQSLSWALTARDADEMHPICPDVAPLTARYFEWARDAELAASAAAKEVVLAISTALEERERCLRQEREELQRRIAEARAARPSAPHPFEDARLTAANCLSRVRQSNPVAHREACVADALNLLESCEPLRTLILPTLLVVLHARLIGHAGLRTVYEGAEYPDVVASLLRAAKLHARGQEGRAVGVILAVAHLFPLHEAFAWHSRLCARFPAEAAQFSALGLRLYLADLNYFGSSGQALRWVDLFADSAVDAPVRLATVAGGSADHVDSERDESDKDDEKGVAASGVQAGTVEEDLLPTHLALCHGVQRLMRRGGVMSAEPDATVMSVALLREFVESVIRVALKARRMRNLHRSWRKFEWRRLHDETRFVPASVESSSFADQSVVAGASGDAGTHAADAKAAVRDLSDAKSDDASESDDGLLTLGDVLAALELGEASYVSAYSTLSRMEEAEEDAEEEDKESESDGELDDEAWSAMLGRGGQGGKATNSDGEEGPEAGIGAMASDSLVGQPAPAAIGASNDSPPFHWVASGFEADDSACTAEYTRLLREVYGLTEASYPRRARGRRFCARRLPMRLYPALDLEAGGSEPEARQLLAETDMAAARDDSHLSDEDSPRTKRRAEYDDAVDVELSDGPESEYEESDGDNAGSWREKTGAEKRQVNVSRSAYLSRFRLIGQSRMQQRMREAMLPVLTSFAMNCFRQPQTESERQRVAAEARLLVERAPVVNSLLSRTHVNARGAASRGLIAERAASRPGDAWLTRMRQRVELRDLRVFGDHSDDEDAEAEGRDAESKEEVKAPMPVDESDSGTEEEVAHEHDAENDSDLERMLSSVTEPTQGEDDEGLTPDQRALMFVVEHDLEHMGDLLDFAFAEQALAVPAPLSAAAQASAQREQLRRELRRAAERAADSFMAEQLAQEALLVSRLNARSEDTVAVARRGDVAEPEAAAT